MTKLRTIRIRPAVSNQIESKCMALLPNRLDRIDVRNDESRPERYDQPRNQAVPKSQSKEKSYPSPSIIVNSRSKSRYPGPPQLALRIPPWQRNFPSPGACQ